MRRTTTSLAGAGAIALALALGVAGCTSDTPAPQDVARQYAEGLARLDLTGVPLDGVDGRVGGRTRRRAAVHHPEGRR